MMWGQDTGTTFGGYVDPEGERTRRGRLILIVEKQLSEASRSTLKDLLRHSVWREDVTMVSGLTRASMLQADEVGDGVFYNRREYISPEQAFALLPWREVWLLAEGRVWRMNETMSDTRMDT